jgi:hypothetical protein
MPYGSRFSGEIGGGWWNAHYVDYFLLLTFGGIPWQVGGIPWQTGTIPWLVDGIPWQAGGIP